MKRAVWLGAMVAVLCLGTTEATATAQRAVPPSIVVDGLRKVVIVDRGDALSREVADGVARLTRVDIGWSRDRIDASPGITTSGFDFTRRRSSSPVSPSAARRMATEAGAQAVVEIHARIHQRSTDTFSRTVTRRIRNSDGEFVEVDVEVPCLERWVRARASADILTAAGEVAGARTFSWTRTSWACEIPWRGESTSDVLSHHELARRALRPAARALARTFLPHWVTFDPRLVRDRVTRPILRRAEPGTALIREPLLRAHERDPYNARVLNLFGVAYEFGGRPADAATLYRLAARLDSRPAYERAATRATRAARQAAVLERAYGLTLRPKEKPAFDRVLARAREAQAIEPGPQTMHLRGTRNRRTPLLSAPSGSAAIVATVPGRVPVTPIYTRDDFIKVELPDGQRGYVPHRRLR